MNSLDREIKAIQHDLDVEHRRKRLNLAYCAKLQARIDELIDERDLAALSEQIILAAVAEHNLQVEETRRLENNP